MFDSHFFQQTISPANVTHHPKRPKPEISALHCPPHLPPCTDRQQRIPLPRPQPAALHPSGKSQPVQHTMGQFLGTLK